MTIILIIITCLISYKGFNDSSVFNKFKFNAYLIYHKKDYQRMISSGFLHQDWPHLVINMFVLFMFGQAIENIFNQLLGSEVLGRLAFVFFYFSAIGVSSVVSLMKHKDNHYYNAIGASGAVSAMVFGSILIEPMRDLCLYGILCLPGIIWGPIYLGYTYWAGKKGNDNIGHDAHFVGAVYGFLFPILLEPALIGHFFQQVLSAF